MKRIFFPLVFLALFTACGGNTESSITEPEIEQATEQDLQTVEETVTIEKTVEEVNNDVDSILNDL